jgi:hypothetical protein
MLQSTPLKVRIVPRRQPRARTSPDDTRGQCSRLRRGLLGTAPEAGRDDRAVFFFDSNLEPQHTLQLDAPSRRTECRAHCLIIHPSAFPVLRARAHHQTISLNEGSLVHPTEGTDCSKEALLRIFDCEIGRHSMISFDQAAHLIAEWQREMVGEEQIGENPAPQQAEAPNRFDLLRKILGGGK